MPTAIKHSRQRDAILNMLRSRYDHPTAEQLYTELKVDFPRLSLGTVYRNLSLLESMGDIIKIPASDNCDRFDGNTKAHYHFVCECCGRIDDVDMPVSFSLDDEVCKSTGAKVKGHSTTFFGVCKKCLKST